MSAVTNETIVKKQISDITLNAFGKAALRIEKLSGLFIGDVYRVTTAGQSVILKLATDNNKEMSLEKNSIRAGIKTLNTVNERELSAFPKVLFHDESKKFINREYYITECLPGVPIDEITKDYPEEKKNDIYSQIGIYTNKVSQNTANYYGSLIDPQKRFSRWSDTFYSMINDVLADAEKSKTTLPFKNDSIKGKFRKFSLVLNTVERPSLVDLNIQSGHFLVDTASDDIMGVIDCECPVYGDYLMYPAAMLLHNDINYVDCFNSGCHFTDEEKMRIALYGIFFGIYLTVKSRIGGRVNSKLLKKATSKLNGSLEYYKDCFGEAF